MTRTPESIKKGVVDSLFWDSRVDASEIKVAVHGDSVTLTGSVPTFEARRAAEEDTWIILGVEHVDNQLAVQLVGEGERLSDRDVLERVECVLGWDADLDVGAIHATVEKGIVTLHGKVRYLWEKIRVQQRIEGLAGVKEIRNELHVEPPEPVADATIATRVCDALTRNLNVDADMIQIEVNGGIVRLRGAVPTHAAHKAALESAGFTDGVVSVEDHIAVDPAVRPTRAGT